MKNRGYTLLELLGVIIILALLTTLVFPSIINSIKKSSDKIDNATIELISNAADLYIDNNLNDFIKNNGNKYEIKLQDLFDSSNLPDSIKLSNEDINNKCVQATYEDNKFVYNLENIGNCETYVPICNKAVILEKGQYTYGDKYVCDPGDGIKRTFYLLEDGDNTELINGNTGTTGTGEISLIMDSNIGTPVAWVESGVVDEGPITALKYLSAQTKEWLNVKINMPTKEQIEKIELSQASWLTNNLSSETIPNGYWLKSVNSDNGEGYKVGVEGISSDLVTKNENIGVRPIITIKKINIEKIEIPEEYQEVEYIEGQQSSNTLKTAGIDLNYYWKDVGKLELSMQFTTLSEDQYGSMIFRTPLSGSSAAPFICSKTDGIFFSEISGSVLNDYTKEELTNNGFKTIEIVIDKNTKKSNLYFGSWSDAAYSKNWQLKQLQVYDTKNNLVRNMIPCYRKSDNVIGMYDTVENKFYINSGTGTFIKGDDI